MVRHDVNINISSLGNMSRITQTNANDDKSIKDLTDAVKESNKELLAKMGSQFEKLVAQSMKDRQIVQEGNNSSSDIDKIVKGAAQELANSTLKLILGSLPKNPSKTTNQGEVAEAVERKLQKSSEALSKDIADKLGKAGVNIDKATLQSIFSESAKKVVPSGLDNAAKDIYSAVASVKALMRDMTTLAGSIMSMRKSGGKVDTSEMGSVVASTNQVIADFKSMASELRKAKESISSMHTESKKVKEDLQNAFNEVQNKATSMVQNVKESASDDPRAFAKEMFKGLSDVLKSSDATKDTNIAKTISGLEGKMSDMSKAMEELRKLPSVIKDEYKSGEVSKDSINKVLEALSKFSSSVGNIPKTSAVQDNGDFGKELSKTIGAISNITKQVDVIVNDKELKAISSKEITVPVTLDTNTRDLYADVNNAVSRAIIDAGNTSKVPVKIGGSLSELKSAIASGDPKAIEDSAKKLTELINSTKGIADSVVSSVKNAISEVKKIDKSTLSPAASIQSSVVQPNVRREDAYFQPINSSFRKPFYKKGVVNPTEEGFVDVVPTLPGVTKDAARVKELTEANIKKLSASLYKLQSDMITEMDKSTSGWSIVKPHSNAKANEVFKLLPGNRQWSADIADEVAIRGAMKNYTASLQDVISSYKKRIAEEIITKDSSPHSMAAKMGSWLKGTTEKEIGANSNIDSITKAALIKLKNRDKGPVAGDAMSKDIINTLGEAGLRDVYKNTYAMDKAEREMRAGDKKVIRSITLPAAGISSTGDVTFQTVHGAERALPKFAKFKTGFEVLYNDMEKNNRKDEAKSLNEKIKALGMRPSPQDLPKADELSDTMMSIVSSYDTNKIIEAYRKAAKYKGLDVEKSTRGLTKAEDFSKGIEDAMQEYFKSPNQSYSGFSKTMKSKGLSPYDVVKSMNSIEVYNPYDILNTVLHGNNKKSPIGELSKKPDYDKSIRDYEKAIREVEGLMPLIEANRPRRGYHQENTVNLLTRTSSLYHDRYERLTPDAQKQMLKELNLELSETIKKRRAVEGENSIPYGLNTISSLGIPESQAGAVDEYRKGNKGGFDYLNALDATSFKMYGDDLTSLAPFKAMQQQGRNISNVTNAMVNLNGMAELPNLRSERERSLIESGRYGRRGYGYNVTAEMRNTASNFEDQIIISGKLAKAMTSAVSNLIKPSPSGRIKDAMSSSGVASSTGVTEMRNQKLVNMRQEIEEASKKYMEIFGVPEEYEGRADEALIKDVERTISVIRGEKVEVQKAKLAETFLSHFGRKFTTRYGSKGVSVSPTGTPPDMENSLMSIIGSNQGKPIKIDPEASLGYQVAPKSMGSLVSDLFGNDMSSKLREKLITSGNKFMIDIFQSDKIVAPNEAKNTQKLYSEFADVWKQKFGTDAPSASPEGIAQIKSMYASKFGKGSDLETKPIDVRISSYGASKRGLQTEFMESIFNNMAGTGEGGFTTLKQFSTEEYNKLLKGGLMTKYSSALGYKGAGKTEEELAPELFGIFGGKGKYEDALVGNDDKNKEKAMLAKKAAALEASTSFYSDVVDEIGKKRTGMVGGKFLQIIEEPHKNPAWERGEIESGEKGARFNIPAYSAYATVFGDKSPFMKELQNSLGPDTTKHLEYMKALQTVGNRDSDIYKNITANLPEVTLENIRPFERSTGRYGTDPEEDSRSFSNTIFDTNAYPNAFKVKLPTGTFNKQGAPEREDFYVPGASARQTYPDSKLAGEYGMDDISRRLTNVINAAKKLDKVMSGGEKQESSSILAGRMKKIVGTWNQEAVKLASEDTPENIAALKQIMERLMPALSRTEGPSNALIPTGTGNKSEYEYAKFKFNEGMGDRYLKNTPEGEVYRKTISLMSDMVIGKSSANSPEQRNAPTALSKAMSSGTVTPLARTLGIDVSDIENKEVENAAASLQRAKIDYYNSLADTVVGKTGSMNELFMNRKIPSIMGKAVTAISDKSNDLSVFRKRLEDINSKYNGIDFSKEIEDVGAVSLQHKKAIDEYRKANYPVLKQDEIGIPTSYAQNIPVSYVKKFGISKKGEITRQTPDTVETTLDRMLEYTSKLKGGRAQEGSGISQEEIANYISKDLVPYVESIRFPFTGTSSIAPFKPKMIQPTDFMDKSGRPLAENALMVPGIPEGVEGLSGVVKSVQDKIDTLVARREHLQTTEGPQEQIDVLNKLIRELSAAISDVIPKYTAQAQKLDYDGDQIEIHSAKTAAAREDIQKHFERFHRANPEGDIRTQDVFMQRFLSDAANLKTTGPYVFGESQAAFEKKFPSGKGFEFMRSPFLNENLDYMSTKQALDVMSGNDQIGDISNVIAEVLQKVNRPEGEIIDVLGKIHDTKGSDDRNADIMKVLEKQYTDPATMNSIKSGIKDRLYESKIGDTVEAQLFKIHTGPETEDMYRIHRLAESATGFGGGLIGNKSTSSDYFKSRYPDLKVLGNNPEEEFNTMINEVLRFGIQKGMDVKHAGEKPVAGRIVNYLSRGDVGAKELWENVQNPKDKSFGDLRDFAADNEKALRLRMGEMPTHEIADEARKLLSSRGESTVKIDQASREELIKTVIDKVGFKGFLEEMSKLIRTEAVNGLVAQANTWTPEKKKKPWYGAKEVGTNTRAWAENVVAEQIAAGGIDINKDITPAQMPLYGMRTFFSSPETEYKKHLSKFGRINVPYESVSALKSDQKDEYSRKYQESVATAENIKNDLNMFGMSPERGAYGDMISSTIDNLYNRQNEIESYARDIIAKGYGEADKGSLVERATSKAGTLPKFMQNIMSMDASHGKFEVQRLSDLTGVPQLSDLEKSGIETSVSPVFATDKRKALENRTDLSDLEKEEEVKKYMDTMSEKAKQLAQLDRISDAIMVKKDEGKVLRDLMPNLSTGAVPKYDDSLAQKYKEMRSKAELNRHVISKSNEAQMYNNDINTDVMYRTGQEAPGSSNVVPQGMKEDFYGKGGSIGGGGGSMPPGSAGIVPVHIVSADPSVTINIRGAISTATGGYPNSTEADMADRLMNSKPYFSMDETIAARDERDKHKDAILESMSPEWSGGESAEKVFTPSKLSAGGKFRSGAEFNEENRMTEQLAGIMAAMTGVKEPMSEASINSTELGKLIHAKLQKSYAGRNDIDIEKYGEFEDAVGGKIRGAADILEYKSPDKSEVSKVIDIKTTDAEKISKLRAAIDKAKSRNINDVINNTDDEDTKRKLNDYLSQINMYLKMFGENAEAELRYYDTAKKGADVNDYEKVSIKFDPERYKKDMEQLAKARDIIKANGLSFTTAGRIPSNNPELPSDEDLDAAMQTILDKKRTPTYSELKNSINKHTLPREGESVMNATSEDAMYNKARREALKNLSPEDEAKYLQPGKPDMGVGNAALFHNLKLLHDQSKIYQKMRGLDLTDMKAFPEPVKGMIEDTKEKGPDYQAFIELTNKLREMHPDQFTYNKSIQAWKAYQAAVGDWYVSRIEEAQDRMIDLEKQPGRESDSQQAYGDFVSRTKAFQESIRRKIGNKTDIYTDDRRFVYPFLAQTAGVYMSPEEIMHKVGEPLGEDDKLISSFKGITDNISSGKKMTSPVTVSRQMFREFSDMNKATQDLLSDGEKLKRLGPEIIDSWDFEKLASRATRMREALQNVLKENGDLTAEQKKNLKSVVGHLTTMENVYGNVPTGELNEGGVGLAQVLRSESPDMQSAMNYRNLQAIMKHLSKPEEEGGAKVGSVQSYVSKTMDAGHVTSSIRFDFKKYGEEVLESGEKVGRFNVSQTNLIEKLQGADHAFGNAIKRVMLWGAASSVVYNTVSYLSKSLETVSKIETEMAQLRMVLNPVQTDFNKLLKTAIGFGKQYGTPVPDILKSMVIFGQQGLDQGEIVERTKTATLASNVSTMDAKSATEALTAAMVTFREEGGKSLKFLDAWSEVEARHAVTAGDLANAIKKSAAAAKVAGFTFDQLNGVTAALVATTRQTGNEAGTSLRFISRRLFTDAGPKALAKLPTPISTVTGEGNNKPAFEVLKELAAQWKDLSEAQKLSVATSIGGTRQYNALLVIMDQWNEVLRATNDSMNSKGASERRNAEIMKTYAKQMEQTKAAATELKVELGNIILPTFKAGLGSFKFLLEAISAIPAPIKFVTTAIALMFGAIAKGAPIIDSLAETFTKGKTAFSGFGEGMSEQMKIAKYEVTGKGDKNDLGYLKTVSAMEGKTQGQSVSDFKSFPGKAAYITKQAGMAFNAAMLAAPIAVGSGAQSVGQGLKKGGTFLSITGDLADGGFSSPKKVLEGLTGSAEKRGLSSEGVKLAFKGGAKGIGKLALEAVAYVTEIIGLAMTIAGKFIDSTGGMLGSAGHKGLQNFATSNQGLIKTIAPMLVTGAVLAPSIKTAYDEFKKLNSTAKEYDEIMHGDKQANDAQLKSIEDMISKYDTLSAKLVDIKKASNPDNKKKRMDYETYEAPLISMAAMKKDATAFSNELADSNMGLVVGYDKLGNAVLKSSGSFKELLEQLHKTKEMKGIKVEMDVLSRYTKDLTETGGSEKFKMVLKGMAESFPVIGDMLAKNINVSPAKALEVATADVNKRLALKQKYPLSTAADEDIKRLQGVLKEAREAFNETYSAFSDSYKRTVAPSNFKGLDKKDVERMLTSKEMQKAYELKIMVEPKFQVAKNIKPTDIMGKEVLTALNPNTAGLLDASKALTISNLETMGIKSSAEGKDKPRLHAGDIVTLSRSAFGADKSIAGDQAIVKLKQEVDGTYKWMAQYFDSKTMEVKEKPLEDIEPLIDNIFPVKKIKEDLSYRMDSLNTFVAGASAGLVGIKAKDFKKDFSLGERFFGEIPTSTLLQGDFGYNPGKGYGKVDAMSSYKKDIEEYYFKPMEDLKTKVEVYEKAKLEGSETGDTTMSKDKYEEIQKLLDVLKNNQVVLQFRAVFVDLMKEFSEGERILKQNLAVFKERFNVEKETFGPMKGVSKNIMDMQLGTTKPLDLTPLQSLFIKDKSAADTAKRIKELGMIMESDYSKIDSVQRAMVNTDEVYKVAKATGAAMPEDKLSAYVEKVARENEDNGPFKEVNRINTKIADNTKDTVERLDRLLENQGDPKAIAEMLSSITDKGLMTGKPTETANALERVAGIRNKAMSKGNDQTVIAANKALDELTQKLIKEAGFDKAKELVRYNPNTNIISSLRGVFKDYTESEFMSRAMNGIDKDTLIEKMKTYAPEDKKTGKLAERPYEERGAFGKIRYWTGGQEELFRRDSFEKSKEYEKIKELQSKENEKPMFGVDTAEKFQAAVGAAAYVEKAGKNRIAATFDKQIKDIDFQISKARSQGKSEEFIRPLAIKQEGLQKKKAEAQADVDYYGLVQSLSIAGVTASKVGQALGLTEKQVKYLNLSAVGLSFAMQQASAITGKELPESAKNFNRELKKVAGKMMDSGDMPKREDMEGLRKAGATLNEEVKRGIKGAFGKSSEDLEKGYNIELSKGNNEKKKETGSGPYIDKIRETKDRIKSALRKGADNILYESDLPPDLRKSHAEEIASFESTYSNMKDTPDYDIQLNAIKNRHKEELELYKKGALKARISRSLLEDASLQQGGSFTPKNETPKDGKQKINEDIVGKAKATKPTQANEQVKSTDQQGSGKGLRESYQEQVKTVNQLKDEISKFRAISQDAANYDDIYTKHSRETAALYAKLGGYKPESPEYKDLMIKQNAEMFEWSRRMNKKDAEELKKQYPVTNTLGGAYSEALKQEYGKDINKAGEKAERGAEVASGPSRLQQMLMMYAAIGMTDYVGKKNKESTELSTLESKMEDQDKALNKMYEKYPEATEKVMKDIYSKAASNEKEGKSTDIATVSKSLVQNTDKTYKEILSTMVEYNKKIVEEARKHAIEMAKAQEDLANKAIIEGDNKEAYNIAASEHTRMLNAEVDRKYSVRNALEKDHSGMDSMYYFKRIFTDPRYKRANSEDYMGGVFGEIKQMFLHPIQRISEIGKDLSKGNIFDAWRKFFMPVIGKRAGSNIKDFFGSIGKKSNYDYVGDAEVLRQDNELSTQERIFKGSDKDFRLAYNSYADAPNVLEAFKKNIKTTMGRMQEEKTIMTTSSDRDAVIHAEERYSALSKQLERTTEQADKYETKLREFAELYTPLQKLSSVVFQLKDALKEVGNTENVGWIKGVQSYRDRSEKLLGGSHPDAIQMITPEEERMGSRYGIKLEPFKSTRYDLEKAKLVDQMTKSTDPSQKIELAQQINDLDEKRRRDLIYRDQQRHESDLKKSLSPYDEQLHLLEKAKSSVGATPEFVSSLTEQQNRISDRLNRAFEQVSTTDYKKELEANKSKITPEEYNQQIERLSQYENSPEYKNQDGNTMLYRGITPWDREGYLSEIPNKEMDTLKKALASTTEGITMTASVADPIASRIDQTNEILTEISNKLGNTDTNPNESMGDFSSRYVDNLLWGNDNTPNFLSYMGNWITKGPLYPFQQAYDDTISETRSRLIDTDKYNKRAEEVKKLREEKELDSILGASKYAIGGYISGPGSGTSDSIFAKLSNGEFVVKADSVKKIGADKLDYMNKTGQIPGFAEGGLADGRFFRNITDSMANAADFLKERRLGKASENADLMFGMGEKGIGDKLLSGGKVAANFLDMAGSAALEIGSKVASAPMGLFSMFEGVSDYTAKTGISGMGKDISEIYKNTVDYYGNKNLGKNFKGDVSDIGKGVYKALSNEIASGGTGITAGVLSILTPGAIKELKGLNAVGEAAGTEEALSASVGRAGRAVEDMDGFASLDEAKAYYDTLKMGNKELSAIKHDFIGADKFNSKVGTNLKTSFDAMDKYTALHPEAATLQHVSYGGDIAESMMDSFSKSGGATFGKLKGIMRGIYSNTKDTLGYNVGKTGNAFMEETVLHELGHHTDKETRIMAKILELDKSNKLGVDDMASKAFMRGRKGIDEILDSYRLADDLPEELFPTKYAFESMKKAKAIEQASGKSSMLGLFETTAEGFAGKGAHLPITKEIQAFNQMIEKHPAVNDMMRSLYANKNYMKLRSIAMKNKTYLPKFAEGGLVSGDAVWYTYDEDGKRRDHSLPSSMTDHNWAISSLNSTNAAVLASSRETNSINEIELPNGTSDNYIGIGAQYNTDLLRRAVSDKKSFYEDKVKRANNIALSRSSQHRDAARNYTDDNSTSFEMNLDSSRELATVKGDLIGYQSKKDLKEANMDFSYNPMQHLRPGYTANREDAVNNYRKNHISDREDGSYPYYTELLKDKQNIMKAAINSGKALPYQLEALTTASNRIDDLMKSFRNGADPLSDKFLTGVNIALTGAVPRGDSAGNPLSMTQYQRLYYGPGGKAVYDPMLISSGLLSKYNTLGGTPVGYLGSSPGSTNGAVNATNSLHNQFFSNNVSEIMDLSDEIARYQEYIDKNSKTRITTPSGNKESVLMEKVKSGELTVQEFHKLMSSKSRVSDVEKGIWKHQLINPFDLYNTVSKLNNGSNDKSREMKGLMMSVGNDDKLRSILGRSAEVMHNGGVVHNDGLVFAQRGELFIPKGFAAGGIVDDSATTSVALGGAQGAVKIDTSDIIKKLESIELKVEDKTLKVEDKTLKVEDKKVEVDAKSIKVEVPDSIEVKKPEWSIEVDKAALPKIQVEKPDWKVGVEIPKDTVTVTVNVDDAANKLKNAITSALDRQIKVEVASSAHGSVGSDQLNKVADMVSKVSDRIIAVKNDMDNKIKMIGANNETINIDRKINNALDVRLTTVTKDMNDIRTSVGDISSQQRQKDVLYQSKLDDLDYRLKSALNVTGIGRGV